MLVFHSSKFLLILQLVQIMRAHISNPDIQTFCCNLLDAIGGFDSLVNAVVDAAMYAMKAHPTNVNLQTEACHILGLVSTSDHWELCIAAVSLLRSVCLQMFHDYRPVAISSETYRCSCHYQFE